MENIYEENLRIAYNAGLIDDDFFDIIKLLKKEGFYSGYNFFAKGIHVIAEKEKTESVTRILEGIAANKNISVYNVNYTGLIFE
jgi:pantoate kinase